MHSRFLVVVLAVAFGCDGAESYGDELSDPQLPPRGSVDLAAWLDEGHYLAWRCETAQHPARPGSGHGPNRICSNELLATASTDVFPVGAAAVKEVWSGTSIRLFAVARKVEPTGGGDAWYWYEGKGDDIVANGEGDSTCTSCHSRAPRDFVFTVVE